MPCSGCGGKGHSPGDTYGHILGCGATKFMEDDRFNPMKMEQQEAALFNAVEIALKSGAQPGTREFVVQLARALAEDLRGRCVDERLYT